MEFCPECKSWRVTETKAPEQTSCVCQACDHTWTIPAQAKAAPQKPDTGNIRPDADRPQG